MNANSSKRMNQTQMLEWIMMLTLCIVDMNLYLDTHPDDEEAIDYFNECAELLKNAKRTYEASYGTFTAFGGAPYETFTWVDTPMPWEGGNR
jgi:spore coat protein JB